MNIELMNLAVKESTRRQLCVLCNEWHEVGRPLILLFTSKNRFYGPVCPECYFAGADAILEKMRELRNRHRFMAYSLKNGMEVCELTGLTPDDAPKYTALADELEYELTQAIELATPAAYAEMQKRPPVNL